MQGFGSLIDIYLSTLAYRLSGMEIDGIRKGIPCFAREVPGPAIAGTGTGTGSQRPSKRKRDDTGDDDGEYEYETEECYLTLDLLDVDPALLSSATSYRLIVSSAVYSCFYFTISFRGFSYS